MRLATSRPSETTWVPKTVAQARQFNGTFHPELAAVSLEIIVPDAVIGARGAVRDAAGIDCKSSMTLLDQPAPTAPAAFIQLPKQPEWIRLPCWYPATRP